MGLINLLSVAVGAGATGKGLRQLMGGKDLAAGESLEKQDLRQDYFLLLLHQPTSLIYFCRSAFEGRDVPGKQAMRMPGFGAILGLQRACVLNRPFVRRGHNEGGGIGSRRPESSLSVHSKWSILIEHPCNLIE